MLLKATAISGKFLCAVQPTFKAYFDLEVTQAATDTELLIEVMRDVMLLDGFNDTFMVSLRKACGCR